MCMMCEPPFGLMPRLHPVGLDGHWPPEFASDESNGENSPPGPELGCGSTTNCTRVPRPCGVMAVADPRSARPASIPGAAASFQRHIPPKVGMNVASRLTVLSKPVPTDAELGQRGHGADRSDFASEVARG